MIGHVLPSISRANRRLREPDGPPRTAPWRPVTGRRIEVRQSGAAAFTRETKGQQWCPISACFGVSRPPLSKPAPIARNIRQPKAASPASFVFSPMSVQPSVPQTQQRLDCPQIMRLVILF
jgi:hypothetical protein